MVRSALSGGLTALAVLLLFPACGDDPEPTYDREMALPQALARLRAEADVLERECVPPVGTARAEVEQRYGEGRPAGRAKRGAEPAVDTRYVAYDLLPPRGEHTLPDGTLTVLYDEAWKVERAHFLDPYATKGRTVVAGGEVPVEELHREAVERLAQMKRIRAELERRAAK